MNFYRQYSVYRDRDIARQVQSVTDNHVQRVLAKHTLSADDFLCLLSPAAMPHLE